MTIKDSPTTSKINVGLNAVNLLTALTNVALLLVIFLKFSDDINELTSIRDDVSGAISTVNGLGDMIEPYLGLIQSTSSTVRVVVPYVGKLANTTQSIEASVQNLTTTIDQLSAIPVCRIPL